VYLFFDTETTGIPRRWRAPVTDLDNWPRVVQIAWVVSSPDGTTAFPESHIVRPEGFTIPPDATRVHGISTEKALKEGMSLHEALTRFSAAAGGCDLAVAHNLEFDLNVLGAEFLRAGLANPIDGMHSRCTMKESTNFCQLPGRYGFKWPTLEELYALLFQQKPTGLHDALADTQACARCFFELRRRGEM
jgi:DNA polymerase-3 subunit epsilon